MVKKSKKKCIECNQPASTEARSYRAFAGAIRYLSKPGECVKCRAPFCLPHSHLSLYDDDCGTLGESWFCYDCIRAHNRAVAKRAKWWCDNVPIIGYLVAWCIASERQELPATSSSLAETEPVPESASPSGLPEAPAGKTPC